MTVTYSQEIVAPIDRVFDLIDDDQKIKLWMDGLEETIYPEGLDREQAVGTTFKQRIREGGRVVEYDGEVTAYDRPHHSTDGGRQWHDVSTPDGPARYGFPIAVDARDPDTAWVAPAISDEQRMAVGQSLCVCRTEDGGQSWRELPQEDCYDLVYRHALDLSGERLAFGSTIGNLFLSDDGGESWAALRHYLPPIYSVRFAV